jgi:uncharacterized protein YecE (DUF72 family)
VSNIRVGTSGWNYPSGRGTWNGVFYPVRRPKGFDELSYYAEHFDTVEVNSTFYGTPKPEITRRWADRTPADFEFAVKLYQKFTHPKMFRQRLEKSLPFDQPDAERPEADSLFTELTRPNQADLDEFRRGIEPLAARAKLGALLAQFPPSFKNTEQERSYLVALLRAFAAYPMAVELRHRSWSDRVGDTIALLNAFGAAWVQIDEPKFRFSIRQNLLPNVQGFYYLRLHGRNAARWWRHEQMEDRYDYLYSAEELREFSTTVSAARRIVKKAYLYTNNHFSAKSVANAVMIKRQLEEPITGTYRPEFVERYPQLRQIVNEDTAETLR